MSPFFRMKRVKPYKSFLRGKNFDKPKNIDGSSQRYRKAFTKGRFKAIEEEAISSYYLNPKL